MTTEIKLSAESNEILENISQQKMAVDVTLKELFSIAHDKLIEIRKTEKELWKTLLKTHNLDSNKTYSADYDKGSDSWVIIERGDKE